MTAEDIENEVRDYINSEFFGSVISAKVENVILSGSRSRGIENAGSDIDIVAEVSSPYKEDALFNILNENPLEISGIRVDINPIRAEETGTLETYLPQAEKYLSEKMKHREMLNTLRERFSEYYNKLYEQGDSSLNGYELAVEKGDEYIKQNPDLVGEFNQLRNDFISSDRETAALAFALADAGIISEFAKEPEPVQKGSIFARMFH